MFGKRYSRKSLNSKTTDCQNISNFQNLKVGIIQNLQERQTQQTIKIVPNGPTPNSNPEVWNRLILG